jgi:hypothetical protein
MSEVQTVQLSMAQKIVIGTVSGVLVIAFGWFGATVSDMRDKVQDTALKMAVIEAKVESSIDLQKRVTVLESDHSAATERVNSLAFRITALEQELHR